MNEPTPLLATGDNYVVGKVSRLGNANHLLGLYQKHNGVYLRLKVHLQNGHILAMEPEEIQQFPEDYNFHIPTAIVRHSRGYHIPGRS